MRRGLSGFVAAMALALAGAAGAQTVDEQGAVREFDAHGEIVIDAQGNVKDVRMDRSAAPAIDALVERAARRWTFEPILRDGAPIEARTGFAVQVRATPVEAGYATRVAKITFQNMRRLIVRSVLMPPSEVAGYGESADALVALRADDTGRITDLAVIGLQTLDGKPLAQGRQARVYEKYVLAMVRKWRFEPARPDIGAGDVIDGLLPIEIRLGDAPRPKAPWTQLKPVPWHATQSVPDVDQLDGGGLVAVDARFKLRGEVAGTAL